MDNARRFRYLDSIFEAGGGQMTDVERRVVMEAQRFGQMRHAYMDNKDPTYTTAATTVHRECVLHDDPRIGGVVPRQ